MSKYSAHESAAILQYAKGEALTHAIVGGFIWLLMVGFGLFKDDTTMLWKLVVLAILGGIGYGIGFIKGVANGSTLVDQERLRNATGR